MNQIDNQEFHYIDEDNVKIGLKEITFENSYNTFKTKYANPNMIIVQDNYGQKVTPLYVKVRKSCFNHQFLPKHVSIISIVPK